MEIWWIILIIVGVVIVLSLLLSIASFSSEKFMEIYNEHSNLYSKDLNILDFIHNLNHLKFNGKIKIAQVDRDVDNFYVSKTKTVALSKKTLSSNSLASFAIVAHEMGHALQDAEGNKLKTLNALRRLGSLIGFLFLPALIAGTVLLFFPNLFSISITLFCIAGGILFLAILIKSITISIEKDASEKGLSFLKEILTSQDVASCKKLLDAARLTYWGDLFRLLFSWTFLTRKTKMFRN